VVVARAAVAGPYVYIHFVEGPAPPKLELPTTEKTTATTEHAGAASNGASTVAGTWNVGTGSVAGYRVPEVLLGQNATAVGRTDRIWGSLTIDGTTVKAGTFNVDMASVVSDQSDRNSRFDGPIMDVSQFPTATLKLTSPIGLGTVPAVGAVGHYQATGSLTMHGVTKTLTFPVSAERVAGEIDVLADVTVPFAQWNIANPSIGGFVSTANEGTLEVLLHLTQGAGNPAAASTGSGGGGGGGPVTVPSTTVPPSRCRRADGSHTSQASLARRVTMRREGAGANETSVRGGSTSFLGMNPSGASLPHSPPANQ
jgi:polyisoprenoid-binding protein YceI